MILGIETSTHVCSVALGSAVNKSEEMRTELRGSHSEKLFLFVRRLFNRSNLTIHDLEAVLVSAGPGSYTGLRIAAAAVKGLLFGTDIPLYEIDTLAGFAAGTLITGNPSPDTKIHSVIDARRHHLYYRSFKMGKDRCLNPEASAQTVELTEIKKLLQPADTIVGTGINRLEDEKVSNLNISGTDGITARALLMIYQKGVQEQDKAWQHFIAKIAPPDFEPRYLGSSQVYKSQ